MGSVALIMGAQSDFIKSHLAKSVDDNQYKSYSNLGEFISDSTTRDIIYDRVMFYEGVLGPNVQEGTAALKLLHDYLEDGRDMTEVIMVSVPKEKGNPYLPIFSRILESPNATPAVIQKVTLPTLVDIMRKSVKEVTISFYQMNKKDEEALSFDPAEVAKPSNSSKKESKGLLGSLFGRKKKEVSAPPVSNIGDAVEEELKQRIEGEQPPPFDAVYGDGVDESYAPDYSEDDPEDSYAPADYDDSELGGNDFVSADLSDIGSETGVFDEENYSSEPAPAYVEEEPAPRVFEVAAPVEETYRAETPQGTVDWPKPVVTDRIVIVTGDRSTGKTVEATTRALEAKPLGSVLYIDLDYDKNGALSVIENTENFLNSGDHSVLSGNPYSESGIDFYAAAWGQKPHGTEWFDWVVDSRNYAGYSKIIIDCPIELLSNLEPLIEHTRVILMLHGTAGGLANYLRVLSDRSNVSDSVAKLLDRRAVAYPIMLDEDFKTTLNYYRDNVINDRVDWLSLIK